MKENQKDVIKFTLLQFRKIYLAFQFGITYVEPVLTLTLHYLLFLPMTIWAKLGAGWAKGLTVGHKAM